MSRPPVASPPSPPSLGDACALRAPALGDPSALGQPLALGGGTTASPCLPDLAAALRHGRAMGLDRQDLLAVLGHLLARNRTWLLAHADHRLEANEAERFAQACLALADDVPLGQWLGHQPFHRIDLHLTPDVLVPRADTETLVEAALGWMAEAPPAWTPAPAQGGTAHPPRRLLDLGTGSGAIVLALAAAQVAVQGAAQAAARPEPHPAWQFTATDASSAALAVAQANGLRLGLPVDWRLGCWWQALQAQERFDLIVSNPPYLAEGDVHLPALRHEPRLALVSGPDGLDALRQLARGAPAHLKPAGRLLLEHGWDQADAVAALLKEAGFDLIHHHQDLAGRRRATSGRLG